MFCFERFNPFRVAGSSPLHSHGFHPRLLLFNPFRVRATAIFNDTIRFSQVGKFEHGFFSGFISSLGGGKFANGDVTGVYMLVFNHLIHGKGENGDPEKDPYYNYGEIKGGVNFSGGLTIGVGYTVEYYHLTGQILHR